MLPKICYNRLATHSLDVNKCLYPIFKGNFFDDNKSS